jgi:hypothetical protein
MRSMRFLLSVVTVALSTGALAGNYAGSGSWVNDQGVSGTYDATLSVDPQADGTMLLSKTVATDTQTMTYTWTIQKIDDTFFHIVVDGQTVGGGYCWHMDDHANTNQTTMNHNKVCHYGLQAADGSKVENTVKVDKDEVSTIGSKWDPVTNARMTWHDHMELVDSRK